MKKPDILADNATIKPLQKKILLNKKGQYIIESNILVGNETIEQPQRAILLNTKGNYT